MTFSNRSPAATFHSHQTITAINEWQQYTGQLNSPWTKSLAFSFCLRSWVVTTGKKRQSQFPFHANFKCEGFFCSQQIVFNLLYILFEKTVKYENKKGQLPGLCSLPVLMHYCQLVWLYSVLIFSIGLYLNGICFTLPNHPCYTAA